MAGNSFDSWDAQVTAGVTFGVDSRCHAVIQYGYHDRFERRCWTSTPKRALTLWDLILYGIIVIQPTAPMSVFGVLSGRGAGMW